MTINSVSLNNDLNNSLKDYLADHLGQAGPMYRKLADAVAAHISSGWLKPGDKLPTHRSLADTLEITVGTVTRAYAEAERRGLLEARVGAGTYVRNMAAPGWAFGNDGLTADACNLGYNLPPLFDRSAMLQQAMSDLSRNPGELNQLLLYQRPEGIPEHRQRIVAWLEKYNIRLRAEQVLLTSGAQNAMQLVLSAFCRSGDTLLVEKLTYPGLINLARQQQLTLKPVEMDEQGLIPEALDNACRQFNPRFIYATPTLQNPTTAIMGEQRRQEIIAVCQQHNVYLIEDEVNGLQPTERPVPMVNMAPEQVIHVGALSKCLAPGLRVGFLQAPEHFLKRLSMTIQNQCWMISPLLTGLACQLLDNGSADQALALIRKEMAARCQLVKECLGDCGVIYKEGCFHAWLPLPDHWGLSDFLRASEEQGVNVKSGELFAPPGCSVPPAVRVAFSAPATQEQLLAGLQVLRRLLLSYPEPQRFI